MKIFIKYKTDGYSYPQKNLDTDKMYAWNGYVFRQFESLQELLVCMQQNKPIMVLSENVGDHMKNDNVDKYVEFVINPSAIAMVFPVRQGDKVTEKKETLLEYTIDWMKDPKSICHSCGFVLDSENACGSVLHDPFRGGPDVSDLVDNYIGSTNKDGITS